MKVVFVAVFNKSSTNWSQSDGLKKNGVDVIEINYRSVASKIGNQKRDELIIQTCITEKPDVVIFSKCNEVHPRVVDECNKVTKTVLWYMDPINSNFSESLIEKIKKCDYTFCALWESYEKAKTIGGDNVHFLHEGFDHIQNYPVDVEYKYDTSFIGMLRNKRVEYQKALGFPVISNAYGEQHSVAVGETKINLNFTEGGTSDRTYKVLASKGFLLTEPWINMEKDFTIGKDLDIFTSVEELKEKIAFYLENEDKRLEISENGFETVKNFSRIDWARKLIKIIEDGS
jgi:hypothetical protein